jgi:1,4-alpha-glucan branching enzyme
MNFDYNFEEIYSSFFSYNAFKTIVNQLDTEEKGIDAFTSSYTHYGIHVDCRTNEIKIKEWAPNARAMYIRGDFSLYFK